MFRREFRKAIEIAERALRDATDKQYDWFRTSITWSMEACRILGRTPEGNIDRVRNAFDTYFESEAKLYKPTNCAVLAECYGVLGQVEAGLSVIEQSFATMQETHERMSEPETWRVKANLLLQLAASNGTTDRARAIREEAEMCLRSAISKAQIQTSKNWELRATVDLGRLLKSSGREEEAVRVVRAAYNWFTEGFDTPDVVQAQALLAEFPTEINSREPVGTV